LDPRYNSFDWETWYECEIFRAEVEAKLDGRSYPGDRSYTAQTSAGFQKTFNELHPHGWRLKQIKGYEKDGDSHFDSVWHKTAMPSKFWGCNHAMNRAGYEAQTARLKMAGYTEVLKSIWKVNGEERIWAVWEIKAISR
jgi:hypothetical protein